MAPPPQGTLATESAVAHIAYTAASHLISVQPQLDQPSLFSARINNYTNAKQRNAFGNVTDVQVVRQNVDPGSQLAAAASIDHSLVAMTTTSSTLVPMIPHLHNVAKKSVVLHVSTPFDHAQVMAIRSSGLIFLHSSTAAEAQVMALISHVIAAKLHRAVVHFFERGSEKDFTDPITVEDIKLLLGGSLENGNGTRNGNSVNGNGASNGNGTAHSDTSDTQSSIDSVFESVNNQLKTTYQPIEYSGTSNVQDVIVTFGNATALFKQAAAEYQVGVVDIRLFRPWSSQRFEEALPRSVKRIAVLEQIHVKTTRWTPLFLDVVSSLNGQNAAALSYGLGHVAPATIKDVMSSIVSNLRSPAPAQNLVVGRTTIPEMDAQLHIPTLESAYNRILDQLFADRLLVANASEGLDATKSSPEYAFGSLTAREEQRQHLSALVATLGKSQQSLPQGVHELITGWLLNKNDAIKSKQYGSELAHKLESLPSSDLVSEILSLRNYFAKTSDWIIASDAWSYDIGSSGFHHVISSGKNVNLLVIDSDPYSTRNTQDPNRRKKDLGLYAMNHGDVYVASVAVYSSYTGVLQALIEADKFNGPSVVLAYLPYNSENDSPLEVMKETKTAIDSGYWPLYRWTPAAGDEEEPKFELDSERVKTELRQFLDRSNHLTQIVRANPHLGKAYSDEGSFAGGLLSKQKAKAREAFESLVGGMSGPPLLILYASDGGVAEALAKKLQRRAKGHTLNARCLSMDDYSLEDLSVEENVVLISSTAGQGEFPQNGREFWKSLSSPTQEYSMSNVHFAVFGLGDSHYWPRKEDAHYYNRPSKQLDAKMELLGAQRLTFIGLGDDQDDDGYETGYKAWEPELWKALGVDQVGGNIDEPPPITNEDIKIASNYLRGTIAEGLEDDSTGALTESDGQLTKFHGIYQQDDRDLREERKAQGLEPAFSFMVRVRVPAGVATPQQWIAMDTISEKWGNDTFKLTTRQTFQFHGIIKRKLRPAIQDINKGLYSTIAACGDVNRNVMCCANPHISTLHKQAFDFSKGLSDHLLPATSAYHEIWLGDKKINDGQVVDHEPLYGPTYLPRKFKIGVAIPPSNDVDVFTNDIGFIAILDKTTGGLEGFNVTIGGGMGQTHNNKKTYPRLGSLIGFVNPEQGNIVAEKIMLVQRDFGDRTNRKHARLKYTIDTYGLEWFKNQVEERLGWKLAPVREFKFETNTDRYGWERGQDGMNHFTMFIENGRVQNEPGFAMKTGLRELADYFEKNHIGEFRLTPNQHLLIAQIPDGNLQGVKDLLAKHKLDNIQHSALRLSSSACVAFPTCGLAFAESERWLPGFVSRIETICEENGLRNDSIVMRVSGCANGCSRPAAAEMAFIGKSYGVYNMYLGGGHHGQRLNKLYKASLNEEQLVENIAPLIKTWAIERQDGEHFGDFCVRTGVIKATREGMDYHEGIPEEE